MWESTTIQCPYCGEAIETEIEASAGSQRYIEDCCVCCRPIELAVTVDDEGRVTEVIARREDD